MGHLKAFIAGIIGLAVFITLLSLLIPSHPTVSRTVVINSNDRQKIMAEVSDLENWKKWHPLLASDSTHVVMGAVTKGTGASCDILYNGKKVQLLIKQVDSSSVVFSLNAEGENNSDNRILVQSMEPLSQLRVDWIATTHLHWYYPWEKFYAIFIDKLTGPGYEAALNGLKKRVETN